MKQWSYYNTCPDCGASLDPGEKCDCKKDTKVLYLCDRKACPVCNNINCNHTNDIHHAANFVEDYPRTYIEQLKTH